MTGIQAFERIAKDIAMQPGKPRRVEFEYKRHGRSVSKVEYSAQPVGCRALEH